MQFFRQWIIDENNNIEDHNTVRIYHETRPYGYLYCHCIIFARAGNADFRCIFPFPFSATAVRLDPAEIRIRAALCADTIWPTDRDNIFGISHRSAGRFVRPSGRHRRMPQEDSKRPLLFPVPRVQRSVSRFRSDINADFEQRDVWVVAPDR